jgi:hypothetical protein
MPSYTVRKNRKYKAKIRLGFDQRHIPNEVIANKVRGFGFSGVEVVGSGRNRVAEAAWLQGDATLTVRMMPGKIDRSESQFPLAALLEAIGSAEELRPASEIPSRGSKAKTNRRRKRRKS